MTKQQTNSSPPFFGNCYLTLHSHQQNDFYVKMGNNENRFRVSLTERGKVTRRCPHYVVVCLFSFLFKTKESRWSVVTAESDVHGERHVSTWLGRGQFRVTVQDSRLLYYLVREIKTWLYTSQYTITHSLYFKTIWWWVPGRHAADWVSV